MITPPDWLYLLWTWNYYCQKSQQQFRQLRFPHGKQVLVDTVFGPLLYIDFVMVHELNGSSIWGYCNISLVQKLRLWYIRWCAFSASQCGTILMFIWSQFCTISYILTQVLFDRHTCVKIWFYSSTTDDPGMFGIHLELWYLYHLTVEYNVFYISIKCHSYYWTIGIIFTSMALDHIHSVKQWYTGCTNWNDYNISINFKELKLTVLSSYIC